MKAASLAIDELVAAIISGVEGMLIVGERNPLPQQRAVYVHHIVAQKAGWERK